MILFKFWDVSFGKEPDIAYANGNGSGESAHVNTVSLEPMLLAHIQYNLNGSNTDGSFTVDDSN